MIVHVSIPAKQPRYVAKTLSIIFGGAAMSFLPAGPDSYQVYFKGSEENAILIEILPSHFTHCLPKQEKSPVIYGTNAGSSNGEEYSGIHFAVTSQVAPEEMEKAAKAAGWRFERHWRGDQFPVYELWVENRFLIEIMTLEDCELYKKTMSPSGWIEAFGLQEVDGVYVPGGGRDDYINRVQSEAKK